ncbi:MAG: energy transducer TonB [Myxococcales bacterium]|nr:energy transducer TonB [Myxococcales bacterium]
MVAPTSITLLSSKLVGMCVAATVTHGAVIGAFLSANAVLGGTRGEEQKPEPIEVAIIKEPEPEPEPILEPEPIPEPEPVPTQKPRRKPPRPRRAPPPPDPIDIPDDPPPKPKKKARRIVGLSLESTTRGGNGPSFAVGNTRMGRTATVTETSPESVTKLVPKRRNRAATRLPIGLQGSGLSKPKYAGRRLQPDYPEIYRAQNLEAKVTVGVTIDTNGKVTKARLIASSPHTLFNDAALRTARRQRWVPAKRDGRPILFSISYSYFFTLKD